MGGPSTRLAALGIEEGMTSIGLKINLGVGDPEWERQWEESVRQRTLELEARKQQKPAIDMSTPRPDKYPDPIN